MTGILAAMWKREILKFVRDRGRVFGALAQPLLLWGLLGLGFSTSFQSGAMSGDAAYLTFLFPGIIALMILFTAIFSTISVVEERQAGFLQAALAAPVRRPLFAFGITLGGTTLALIQALVLVPLVFFLDHQFSAAGLLWVLLFSFTLGTAFTALGVAMAWRVETTRGFHGIMNVFLMPLWLLSGAFFPFEGASRVMQWIMQANPVSYAVNGLRIAFFGEGASALGGLTVAAVISVFFAAGMVALAIASLRRSAYPRPDAAVCPSA